MKLNLKERIKSPFFWLAILLAISVISGILFRIFGVHWMYVTAFVPWAPIGLFIIVGLVYAIFINPIRGLIQKIKKKKEEKE